MWCGQCGEAVDVEDICRTCGVCDVCCDCDDPVNSGTFDADEFGWEPEDEFERRTR
jgi:hypothetical protein